jgi:hypothetical protein
LKDPDHAQSNDSPHSHGGHQRRRSAQCLCYGADHASRVKPAAGADRQSVPVKEVVLYTSGVGYFEHFGSVKGDGFTELHFKTSQINDILKSLLLEDLDGGKVASVTYGSQEPLAHTLKSFRGRSQAQRRR